MHAIMPALGSLVLAMPAFEGRVEGGWGYVWFCYALAWLSLLAYAGFLLRLRRRLAARLPPEATPPECADKTQAGTSPGNAAPAEADAAQAAAQANADYTPPTPPADGD